MKILIASPVFYPSVGGIETITDTLAIGISSLGHQVKVITPQVLPSDTNELMRNFEILRNPSHLTFLRAIRDCDAFIQNSISLKNFWPLLVYRRKWIVTHHGPLFNHSLKLKMIKKLKLFLTRFAVNVGVSKFIGSQFSKKFYVIPNPINLEFFQIVNTINKDKDFVFVGRLVKEKGTHLFLEALKCAQIINPSIHATIIGIGPELENLKKQASSLALNDYVIFKGKLCGESLIREISRHKVMVIPSIGQEAFGVVALEGLACGCNIVATEVGGLPEALDDCGVIVDPENVHALLHGMLKASSSVFDNQKVSIHLKKHTSSSIAKSYLQLINST